MEVLEENNAVHERRTAEQACTEPVCKADKFYAT